MEKYSSLCCSIEEIHQVAISSIPSDLFTVPLPRVGLFFVRFSSFAVLPPSRSSPRYARAESLRVPVLPITSTTSAVAGVDGGRTTGDDRTAVKDGFGNHDSETTTGFGNYSLIRHNGKHTTKTRQIYCISKCLLPTKAIFDSRAIPLRMSMSDISVQGSFCAAAA